eukprot:CAMPEP_0119036292 /NCGR_PEP_ID=MMETSP1177-20130426/3915_1 /TAXON_ID=2985 /ORGANISM="Ochromonas sp, Strain CCMP1899" /LENGTH=468 /DNA_ID=CAMNT_0006995937 /DNA_START=108 /DNA_END=1514 /DNA_ORIENTATION=-
MITRVLNHFFPNPPIPLNHVDNFSLLVSVVLSAQTTDGKVNEVTEKLFKVAPTPQLLSAMEASEIQKIIQPVGLAPKKSVYLKKLSQMMIDKFDGEVPNTYESLESLPGVGHKTASVVMSQAFGESALGVDTHVHRLSLRWGLSKHEKNVDKVQIDLHRQFPEEEWNKIHLQMIYFGREYCTAKLHEAKDCPMCSWVNKKDGQPSVLTSTFTPKKKSKGILFYEERTSELKEKPHLARAAGILTPSKVKIELTDVKIDSEPTKVGKEKKVRVSKTNVKVEGIDSDIQIEEGGKEKKVRVTKIKVEGVDSFKKMTKKELKRQADSFIEASNIIDDSSTSNAKIKGEVADSLKNMTEKVTKKVLKRQSECLVEASNVIDDLSTSNVKTPSKKQKIDGNIIIKDEINSIKKPIKILKIASKNTEIAKNVVVDNELSDNSAISESVMKIEFTKEESKNGKKKGGGGGLCQIN